MDISNQSLKLAFILTLSQFRESYPQIECGMWVSRDPFFLPQNERPVKLGFCESQDSLWSPIDDSVQRFKATNIYCPREGADKTDCSRGLLLLHGLLAWYCLCSLQPWDCHTLLLLHLLATGHFFMYLLKQIFYSHLYLLLPYLFCPGAVRHGKGCKESLLTLKWLASFSHGHVQLTGTAINECRQAFLSLGFL